jgi:dihydroxyacetone kinase-like predicted kinase
MSFPYLMVIPETNMYLTLMSAVREGEKNRTNHWANWPSQYPWDPLWGPAVISGVILSQIFRGIARTLEGKEQANAADVAQALKPEPPQLMKR